MTRFETAIYSTSPSVGAVAGGLGFSNESGGFETFNADAEQVLQNRFSTSIGADCDRI